MKRESLAVQVSIVAPFYNEEENLGALCERVRTAMDASPWDWELLLVDDCSDDGGTAVVREAQEADARIRLISLAERAGQSGALWTGIRHCRGRIVVTLDADLQNPPSEIPRLVETLYSSRADVVAGVRASRRDSLARRVASRGANAVRRLVLGDPFRDIGCSLRAYRSSMLDRVPCFSTLHRFLPIIALWNGGKVVQIEVAHLPREHGDSKYSAVRGRALTGAFDLFGIVWLRRRWLSSLHVGTEAPPVLADETDGDRVQFSRPLQGHGPNECA